MSEVYDTGNESTNFVCVEESMSKQKEYDVLVIVVEKIGKIYGEPSKKYWLATVSDVKDAEVLAESTQNVVCGIQTFIELTRNRS